MVCSWSNPPEQMHQESWFKTEKTGSRGDDSDWTGLAGKFKVTCLDSKSKRNENYEKRRKQTKTCFLFWEMSLEISLKTT